MRRSVYLRVSDKQGHKKQALLKGVQNLGFEVVKQIQDLKGDRPLLLSWNLHGMESWADSIRDRGGQVLVTENPYLKFDRAGNEYLALARNGHNGSGQIPQERDRIRLDRLGVEFQPWRWSGEYVLLAEQRGIGGSLMRSPPDWGPQTALELKKHTKRPIVLRPHPGRLRHTTVRDLKDDLARAYCLVVWSSNTATEALIQGIPVFYTAPYIVTKAACKRGLDLNNPIRGDHREAAFLDLSWSQWSLSEISSGEAIKRLLDLPEEL